MATTSTNTRDKDGAEGLSSQLGFPDFVVECLDMKSEGYEAAHIASYEAAD
jgi:hypothetical protein